MKNLFQILNKHLDNATKDFSDMHYWEQNTSSQFNDNAISPDGTAYDERELVNTIQNADKERLLRFN